MKKYILIALITIFIISPKAFTEETNDIEKFLGDTDFVQEQFYEPPSVKREKNNSPENETQINRVQPLFKQMRIRLTNFVREKDYKYTQKQIKKEIERQKKIDEEYFNDLDEETKEQILETQAETKQETENITSDDTLMLEGAVKEQVTSKDAQLDADKIRFDQKTMDIIATGSPVLYFPPQKTTIKAKKMIYNHASNILRAIDNVEIIKDGQKTYGDYFEVNMNEEVGFLNNIKSKISFLTLTARKADMDEKKIVLYDGQLVSENSFIVRLETDMIGGNEYKKIFVPEDEKSTLFDITGDTKINIKADEVIIDAKKNNNTVTLKKAKIRYGDVDLYTIPSITMHTNKNSEYFEANYPEFGSRSRLGMFIGPGFVFDTPLQEGSSVKVIPVINSGDKGFGFGGLLKYHSATNQTDFGYVTSYNAPVLQGRQKLDDNLYIQYGMNSYLDDWFLGRRMSKYNAELIYRDSYRIPKTFSENLGFTYKHRAGIGYMHNNDYGKNGERLSRDNLGTTRFRYMAEGYQELFKYQNPEESLFARLGLVMQGSAAVYGTGDTQFIGRIGPTLETQYKRWFQSLRYYVSAYEDNTPMPSYDAYRYGHGSLYIREAFRVCKYLTLAWSLAINTTNDTPNRSLLQENTFIVMLGPDDLKIHLGYDLEREQMFFACVIGLDTKGSSIDYKKMTIKNPERLANNETKHVELKVFDNIDEQQKDKQKTQKRMMYAEVIDIEDPDKERI